MAELDIDISGHTCNHVDQYMQDQFDYVITVCDNARENCPVFTCESRRLHWPINDPATATGSDEEVLTEFRRIRDEIKAKVENWLESFE